MSTVDCTFQNLHVLQDKIIELGSCLSSVKPVSPKESNKAYLDYLWNTRIKAYLSKSGKNDPKQEKLKICYRKWENVRDNLAVKHMHLVQRIAKKFSHPNLDYNDLVQEGSKGLLRAIDSFNPDLGVPFEAFAPCWIRKYISKLVENDSEIIRIPDSAVRKRQLQDCCSHKLQFNDILTETGEELFCGEKSNPEQQLVAENQSKIIGESIDTLPQLQREIIQLRYLGGREISLEWTGLKCGCSREKARIQEMRALKAINTKLRNIR